MSWIDQRPDDAMDGAFTAVAPGPVVSVEPLVFREAMSRLGAAVHVVTSAGAAGKTGFTATAVCSVSDSPATLLVCLNRRSNSAPVLAQNGVFCVNTLGAGEEKLADLFAGKSGVHLHERFSHGRMDHAKDAARRCSPPPWSRSIAAPSKPRRSPRTMSYSARSKRCGSGRRAGARLSRPGL